MASSQDLNPQYRGVKFREWTNKHLFYSLPHENIRSDSITEGADLGDESFKRKGSFLSRSGNVDKY